MITLVDVAWASRAHGLRQVKSAAHAFGAAIVAIATLAAIAVTATRSAAVAVLAALAALSAHVGNNEDAFWSYNTATEKKNAK